MATCNQLRTYEILRNDRKGNGKSILWYIQIPKMLSKSDFQEAVAYEKYIYEKMTRNENNSDEDRFLHRWDRRFESEDHVTACLIDRGIQISLGIRKGVMPSKFNHSAYDYNCEVAHFSRDYRGLPPVDLDDDEQWDEAINQPKSTDSRYLSDRIKHPRNQVFQPSSSWQSAPRGAHQLPQRVHHSIQQTSSHRSRQSGIRRQQNSAIPTRALANLSIIRSASQSQQQNARFNIQQSNRFANQQQPYHR